MPIGSKHDPVTGAPSIADAAKSQAQESSWRRGLRKMEESDAFEVNEEALAAFERRSALLDEERSVLHRKIAVLAVALTVVFFISLCISVTYYEFIPPGEVLDCIALFFQQLFDSIFTTNIPLNVSEIQQLQPNYFQVTSRFTITTLTVLCGAMLALAGMLYQNVFKNPIAAPTMLGVQSGVNLGLLILVIMLGVNAVNAVGLRYVLCYGCAVGVLAAVMGFGRLIGGKGSFNIVNMMLVGSIISQLFGTLVTFVTNLLMDTDTYEVFFELQNQTAVDASWVSWLGVVAAFVIGVVPLFLFKFSMNALSFSDDDSRLLGVNPDVLRAVALGCGSVMVTGSIVYCGMVSTVSLLVPHISRMLFGAEFGKQLWGNMLIGALLLLVCRDITAFIPFVDNPLPIGTAVAFVTMPFFVWMLAVQQRSWE